MRRFDVRKVLTAIATALVAAAFAAAAQAGTIQVSGVQSPQQADGSYLMGGSLIGVWWTTSFYVREFEVSGGVQGSGTETFVGCLDANGDHACDLGDPSGTIDFAFTYSTKYDPSFSVEIHGRGHHAIVGGTGGITAARGGA